MYKTLLKILYQVPVAYNGITIGCLTLSTFYEHLRWPIPHLIFLLIGIVLFAIKVGKYILCQDILRLELNSYLQGGYLPLFSMSLAGLAYLLRVNLPIVANGLWYIALLVHLGLLIFFFVQQYHNQQLKLILPSWFIPPIGFIAVGLAAYTPIQIMISHYIYIFALFMILPLSVVIVLRQLIYPLTLLELYSTGIYAAPLSLLILALGKYSLPAYHDLLITTLFFVNLLFNLFSCIGLLICLRSSFSVALGAFTFPFAISALANVQLADKLGIVALIAGDSAAIIATVMTIYILLQEICKCRE